MSIYTLGSAGCYGSALRNHPPNTQLCPFDYLSPPSLCMSPSNRTRSELASSINTSSGQTQDCVNQAKQDEQDDLEYWKDWYFEKVCKFGETDLRKAKFNARKALMTALLEGPSMYSSFGSFQLLFYRIIHVSTASGMPGIDQELREAFYERSDS
jgi:hypothetical protein